MTLPALVRIEGLVEQLEQAVERAGSYREAIVRERPETGAADSADDLCYHLGAALEAAESLLEHY